MLYWFKRTIKNLTVNITTIPEPLQSSNFKGLDGLRGLAVLCVIFSHAFLYHGISYFCYGLGMIGVQTFFVISGFLITSLLLKEKVKNGKVSFKNFYIRRFLRLVPVAYLFLAIICILAKPLNWDLSIGAVLSAALYVKNIPIVHGHDAYIGHYWTLGIEEQFYLLFPALLIYKPNKYLIAVVLLAMLIPVISYLGYNKVGVFYTNRFIHLVAFAIINLFGNGTFAILAGSILSVLMFKGLIKIKQKSPYILSLLVFITVAAFRAATVYNFHNVDFGIIVFSIGIAYVILLNLNGTDLFAYILNHPIMIKIGVLSYSLYIWQALFLRFFAWNGWFKNVDSLWLDIPALFLVSYISYELYEKRFLKIKAKYH